MKERIRILYVTDGLGNGGKERQLIETVKHINRDIFSPGIVTFSGNQHYTQAAEETSDFFRILPKEKSLAEPVFAVAESFERFRPHVVHSFDIISAFYTYLPSLLYGSRILNASIQDAGLDKGWQRNLKLMLIRHADSVVGNSFKGLKEYGVEGEVLYNFIEESRFLGHNAGGKFIAAMVANFSIYKDYDSYFRVVKKLLEENLIDEAYAIGSGSRLEEYKGLVGTFDCSVRDKIKFTGSINNVEEVLSSISAGFLFSTEEYGEGISNSVLEYMAAGAIAIASDIGAVNEIIDNGINGFLVNKYDIESITEIIKLIRNDRETYEKIRLNALDTVRAKFSLKTNIRKLEDLYIKLAGE